MAAACAVGYTSIGIERDPRYFELARDAVPKLAQLRVVDKPARSLQAR